MHTKLSIPERLKDLRVVDKHLTLEQLAEQTGLSKSALSKYESDDYKDISPFARALNFSSLPSTDSRRSAFLSFVAAYFSKAAFIFASLGALKKI